MLTQTNCAERLSKHPQAWLTLVFAFSRRIFRLARAGIFGGKTRPAAQQSDPRDVLSRGTMDNTILPSPACLLCSRPPYMYPSHHIHHLGAGQGVGKKKKEEEKDGAELSSIVLHEALLDSATTQAKIVACRYWGRDRSWSR